MTTTSLPAVKVLAVERVVPVGAVLGEGPVWVERDQSFWFVDIKSALIYRLAVESNRLNSWKAPGEVTWIVPTSDGNFLAGMAGAIHQFCPESGCFTHIHQVEPHLKHNRTNDAAVDVAGRVWFGTMDGLEVSASGRFYLYQDGAVRDCGLEAICITNGPAVSPDGATLYTVDTLGRAVDAHRIGTDGSLSEKRRFVTIDAEHGYPDGVVCDAEGGLWLGLWGGGCARRYDDKGRITHEIRLPVSNVTKVALGGANGRIGIATTARKGLSQHQLTAQPHAGDVFIFEVDVPGPTISEVPVLRAD